MFYTLKRFKNFTLLKNVVAHSATSEPLVNPVEQFHQSISIFMQYLEQKSLRYLAAIIQH